MNTYSLNSHMEDLALHVEAKTLKSLFLTAFQGMNEAMKKDYVKLKSPFRVKEKIELRADDESGLLISFLSELLIRSQIKKALFRKIVFKKFSETFLTAIIYGVSIKKFDRDIKSVTRHEGKILINPTGNYETVIVLEV